MPEKIHFPRLSSNQWLPAAMMLLGGGLLLAVLVLLLVTRGQVGVRAAPAPMEMAGFPLTQQESGEDASADLTRLHGKSFPVTAGTKAVYGSRGEVTLWVAAAASNAETQQMLEDMRDRIAEGRSPFQPIGQITDGSRTVYALDGMGQRHFYFQSGRYLVWMAAEAELVDQALSQALAYYR